MKSALEVARAMHSRGWSPLPLPYASKVPALTGWQSLRITEAELDKYFNGHQQNIGVILGAASNHLVDLDLDCDEAVVLAPEFLPVTQSIFGRQSRGSSHYLYYSNARTKQFTDPTRVHQHADDKKSMLVEVRGEGCQTVMPGSLHPSGELISWEADGEVATVPAAELLMCSSRLSAAALLARHWPEEGGRHHASLALVGGLLNIGFTEQDTAHFVKAVCRAADDEETPSRVRNVVSTASKGARGQHVTGWPTLRQYIDERVVDRIREWLSYGFGGLDDDPESEINNPLQVVCMSEVAVEPVTWLWRPYIAYGKLTIIEGDPGVGKSWLTTAVAAALSSGIALPCSEVLATINALTCSAAAGLADTIRPRLDILGADVSRVFAIPEQFTLDQFGLARLDSAIRRYEAKLVVIDPIFAYTGGKVNIDKANQCRAITAKLAHIAQCCGCAIIIVRHLGKSRGLGHALNAGIGSIDITASARSVLLVGMDADDDAKRAMVQTKNNLSPPGSAIGYKLDSRGFSWTGISDVTAARILTLPTRETERSKIEEAEEFLKCTLALQARPVNEILAEAGDAGISEATLRRAKDRLHICSGKEGGYFGGDAGHWMWRFPKPSEGDRARTEGCHPGRDDHLQASPAVKYTWPQHLAEDDHAWTGE